MKELFVQVHYHCRTYPGHFGLIHGPSHSLVLERCDIGRKIGPVESNRRALYSTKFASNSPSPGITITASFDSDYNTIETTSSAIDNIAKSSILVLMRKQGFMACEIFIYALLNQ